jgi:hypothetical protein
MLQVRSSFPQQFLRSSTLFANLAAAMEPAEDPSTADQETRTKYMGLVTAAVIQCVAAVEAESAELLMYGPGYHLGSGPDGVDVQARDHLAPLFKVTDRPGMALERYALALHFLRKEPLKRSEEPWQSMVLLTKLRNELVHYKSTWSDAIDSTDELFRAFRPLNLRESPFYTPSTTFFPFRLLSAACAAWSVSTAVAFIAAVYERLEVASPLKDYMAHFDGLPKQSKAGSNGR